MNFVSTKFVEYYKQHPANTSLNVLLSMTFPIDDLLVPYFTSMIVNNVQNKKPWLKTFIILIIILLVTQVLYSLTSWHDAIIIPSMQNYIKHEIVADLLKKFEFSCKEPIIGEIMSRIVKIPLTLTVLYEQIKNYILAYFISFIITGIYIMTIDKTLGIVVLTCVIMVFIIVVFSPLRCMSATEKQENSLSKLDEESEDILRNINNIYINNQTQNELNRLKGYETTYEKLYMTTTTCTIKTRIIAIIILALMMSFVAYRSYTGINNGTLTIGAFVAIFLILTNWFNTFSWIIGSIRDMVINWGIIDAYEKMMNNQVDALPDKSVSRYDYSIIPPTSGILFYNLSYSIKNKLIIDDITLYVPQYERLVIIGSIGSGKTTLFKLLLGLQKPTSGEIYIDGKPISSMNMKELRKIITYVPQHPVLFNRSILENITYGLPQKPDINTIKSLIDELGLSDSFSDLNASAGKNGSNLSGGQKQIIAIMRAFLLNPKIIALDEITSSIDENTKEKLFKVFQRLFMDKTVIMITHDPAILKLGTKKCEMSHGKLAC